MAINVGDSIRYLSDGEICEVLKVNADGSFEVCTEEFGICTEWPDDVEILPRETD